MKAFRAVRYYNTTPTVSVNTAIDFDTEEFDTDNGLASGTFIVPAAWNGLYGELFGGFVLSAAVDSRISIMKSTDGGASYFEVANLGYRDAADGFKYSINSGPLLFTTSHRYQIRVLVEAAASVLGCDATFFSGVAYDATTQHAFFRATMHDGFTNVGVSSSATPNYNGPYFGDPSFFVRNLFTVPASLNGAYGIFSHFVDIHNTIPKTTAVERSTDGGTNWIEMCATRSGGFQETGQCISGPIQLVTGHKYRHRITNHSGTNNINVYGLLASSSYYDPSFFSAHFFRDDPSNDPFFSSVVLLMHFDGVDGSTTFTDHSSSAKTLTRIGNAQIDTAQSKFGGASGLFDGTTDRVTAADSADWHFGSGTSPFTIELFARHSANVANTTYVTQWSDGWAFYIETSQLKFRAINDSGGGILDLVYTWTPTLNQWYHLCAERDTAGKMRLYIDGVMVASHASTFNVTLRNSTVGLAVGAIGVAGAFPSFDYEGWIDELRITKGVARYASDSGFTVPTAAFPNA